MLISNVKKNSSKICKCNCCLNPILSFPTYDHQNSASFNHSSTFHYDFATATTSSLYPHIHFTNPESLPTLPQSFRSFTSSFPHYLTTIEADQIRHNEYRHLLNSSHVCLDYYGHSLFSLPQTQQRESRDSCVASSSSSTVIPHSKPPCLDVSHKERESLSLSLSLSSSSSSSSTSSEFESRLKERIMSCLNVSEDDYSIFFTPNQTSAFKIIAESYPFQSNKGLITVYDHENEAVETMIKCSRNRGARVSSAEFKWPKLKIYGSKLREMIVGSSKKKKMNKGLFVFPVQSRVSGARYSYQWMSIARENGWHVLLDATALSPKEMDTLGLSLFRSDFISCAFYNVFGDDPSGFACLLVRKSISPILDHSNIFSARGIVSLIYAGYQGRVLGYQDGKFSDRKDGPREEMKVRDIECKGLDHADALGLVVIGNRVRCLINWLTNALLALYHPHSEIDKQLVQVYGPRVKFERGSSLAFNLFDWKGERVDPTLVQKIADRNNISLGCGIIKHVWFSERYEVEREKLLMKGTNNKEVRGKSFKGKKSENFEIGIPVIVVNVGFLSNFEDVYTMWKFASKFLDADFVEKERWRYTALNQKSIEV